MVLQFVGADHEVTGSCHYLQVGNKSILIDCGMRQGGMKFENVPMPVPASRIDFVIVTHAHIDHTGMLPKLYKDGFRGQVAATEATASLCDIMLRDSAHIQTMETEWRNKKEKRIGNEEPYEAIYTMEDAMNLIRLIAPYEYGKIYTLCEGVRFRFTDIGHLLGSASVELWLTEGRTEKKIVFSGDIGNKDQPLLKDPAFTDTADYVVMESTYGDRLHEGDWAPPVEELADILRSTGIEPEYSDSGYTVLMAGVGNTLQDFERLVGAFEKIPVRPPLERELLPLCKAGRAVSVRQAAFGRYKTVSVDSALGKVCALTVTACQPSVPVAVSGEVISEQIIKILKRYSIFEINVLY